MTRAGHRGQQMGFPDEGDGDPRQVGGRWTTTHIFLRQDGADVSDDGIIVQKMPVTSLRRLFDR